MFVCGGENAYPGEIEKLLERHPDILQAAVVPANDEVKGAIPIAFVVCTPGGGATEEEIKAFTIEHGPAYSHPRAVVFLNALPVGGCHKIDRAVLARQAEEVAQRLGR
jgi:long-chain acyl-CoA synthetase